MEISDNLRVLFSASVEKQEKSYVIEVPDQELQLGDIEEGGTYRVAILPSPPDCDTGEAGPGRSEIVMHRRRRLKKAISAR